MDEVNIADQYFTAEDKSLRIVIYQDPIDPLTGTHTGPVQNITGWTLSWMVKRRKTHADLSALITKTTGGGGISITNGPAGELVIGVDDADIDDIVAGQLYWHELKRMDSGVLTVLVQGTFMLNQALHRT